MIRPGGLLLIVPYRVGLSFRLFHLTELLISNCLTRLEIMYVKQSECAFDGLIFLPLVMIGMRFFFSLSLRFPCLSIHLKYRFYGSEYVCSICTRAFDECWQI
jgi:hypothetical protein